MGDGAMRLRDYPSDRVTIACEHCRHVRTWPKTELLERFGADAAMPGVLRELTARCAERRKLGTATCKAIYAEVAKCVSLPPA